jgi:hypothetical protein
MFEQPSFQPEKKEARMPEANAMAEVMVIYQQVQVMGANDSEHQSFRVIQEKLAKGQYDDPRQAVAEARGIMNSKQDYH